MASFMNVSLGGVVEEHEPGEEERRELDGDRLLGHGEEPPREAAEEGSPLVARLEGQRRQKVHYAQVIL